MRTNDKHAGYKDETRFYLHIDNQRRRIRKTVLAEVIEVAERWAAGRPYYIIEETHRMVHDRVVRVTPLPHPDPPIL